MMGNFNEEKNYEEIIINIKNLGLGLVIIKYVKFFYDEKLYIEIFEVIKDCCFDIYVY